MNESPFRSQIVNKPGCWYLDASTGLTLTTNYVTIPGLETTLPPGTYQIVFSVKFVTDPGGSNILMAKVHVDGVEVEREVLNSDFPNRYTNSRTIRISLTDTAEITLKGKKENYIYARIWAATMTILQVRAKN